MKFPFDSNLLEVLERAILKLFQNCSRYTNADMVGPYTLWRSVKISNFFLNKCPKVERFKNPSLKIDEIHGTHANRTPDLPQNQLAVRKCWLLRKEEGKTKEGSLSDGPYVCCYHCTIMHFYDFWSGTYELIFIQEFLHLTISQDLNIGKIKSLLICLFSHPSFLS